MTGIEMDDLQEQKQEIASGLDGLSGEELLMVHGVVQGFKMAREIAAENAKNSEKTP